MTTALALCLGAAGLDQVSAQTAVQTAGQAVPAATAPAERSDDELWNELKALSGSPVEDGLWEAAEAATEHVFGSALERETGEKVFETIAAALERAGRLTEAIAYYEEVLPLTQKAYGASHPHVLGLQLKVAAHYVGRSRLADAREILAQLQRQRDGGAAKMLGDVWMLEGRILIAEERRDDAREPLRRALEWFTAKDGNASASATAAAAALKSCQDDRDR